jgi:hypothetical protein
VQVSLEWEVPNYSQVSEGLMILTVPFLTGLESNPLVQEERVLPLEFDYPVRLVERSLLRAPPGHRLADKPGGLVTDNGAASYEARHGVVSGELHSTRRLSLKREEISAKHYGEMKDFYARVVAGDSERIVFQRVP